MSAADPGTKPLLPLLANQRDAADPGVHAWVAASAGTGKTQVLTARVLRLLLAGAQAQSILCLTFTKLAAAEMQGRVMARLAHWAGCDDAALVADLAAISAPADADTLALARRLFARVLETPAGLAIQTIHAFAQGLIASFPVEAGITPGFQTLDDRAAALLRRRVLTAALSDTRDAAFAADVADVAVDGGETRLNEIMDAIGPHGPALAALRVEAVAPMLRRHLGLPGDGSAAAALAAALPGLPWTRIGDLARALGQQDGKNALKLADMLAGLLVEADPAKRWAGLWQAFFTTANEPRKPSGMIPKALDEADPDWRPFCETVQAQLLSIRAEQERWAILDVGGRHLRLAVRLAQDWQEAKAHAGVIDYDDMIRAAARLLAEPGAADWVRFKLDARIDHILVDEAQDTNLLQWDVIRALAEEYFAGQGQREGFRSLFVVGDFKQSIFSFQGADPQVYADQREVFVQLCEAEPERWKQLPLSVNFRSAPAILEIVDRVIGHIGDGPFSGEPVPPHVAHAADAAGAVTLWPPLLPNDGDVDADANGDDEPAAVPLATDIAMAHRIADSIAGWLNPADPLWLPASGRPAAPQDVLVLVRSRGRLMNALVAALHEKGVPVAGVDRLNLSEPLAVADLIALVQFALQPADDLTLAALLVSPFCGLDHDTLTELAAGRTGTLWAAVESSDLPAVAAARDTLRAVLRLSGEVSPYRFLEAILSGPLQGRQKLLARLGEEARDAIDTVLDQALACEAAGAASLQAFLVWMAAEALEVKRDPDAPLDAVRLMTVHGAKGLEAPIVILADACAAPKKASGRVALSFDNGPELPLWLPSGLVAPPESVAAAQAERDRRAAEEHRRLLYVALTRPRELLFIGGASRPTKDRDVPAESWYAIVEDALADMGLEPQRDRVWGALRRHGSGTPAPPARPTIRPEPARQQADPWWLRPAPQEARPPRPLSPSSLGPDTLSLPPPDASRRAAARRGTALHRLFEVLPDLPPARRADVARQWCALNVPDLDAGEMLATVLSVLDDPAFAAVFAPGALTEAPVAAVVGEAVIAGSIDRLLVTQTDVLAVDFKTGSRVPASLAEVPEAHGVQMAAYAAALARVFPGRRVRAALLYTAGPRLIELPADALATWQPSTALQAGGPALISPA
ncbi:MAG: double-strand break repair helicase AddA [Sandarakinorhabdus sp.]|jgi:ATP-dependent helicase/nuclease subunit A|nr:double-strand break repair helicase AddA [Sandarakinorhabdus sp.]